MATKNTSPLLRVKPMAAILQQSREDDSGEGLKRTLGPLTITLMGVGAIVGTGIFVLTGVAAARYAGPGLIISFVLSGFVSALAALCYAEFASSIPIAGSAYTYSYATLGEIFAWIIGWDLILEYALGGAAVAIGWSAYMTDFLRAIGISLPQAWTASPFNGGIINLPAVLIILLITALLAIGTSESAKFNNIVVVIKIGVILLFIGVGLFHINPANWHPFLPYGIGGIFHGASIIFFAYSGFDQISTSAEETRHPAKDLPIGILSSLTICTILYIVVTAVLTGMVSYKALDVASPVSHALVLIGQNALSSVISIGAIAGLTTVLLVLLFGQSRILFSMARDGLLPSGLATIHPWHRTPYVASWTIGIVIAIGAALTPIDTVAELANIGTLSAFVLVAFAVLVLRRTQPDLHRAFRVPFVPVLPVLSILASFALIVSLPLITILRFIIWLILGLVIYFTYSYRRSLLQKEY